MSEWPIYILWRPVAMFMLITCKLYILVWNKGSCNKLIQDCRHNYKKKFWKKRVKSSENRETKFSQLIFNKTYLCDTSDQCAAKSPMQL